MASNESEEAIGKTTQHKQGAQRGQCKAKNYPGGRQLKKWPAALDRYTN